MNFSRTLIIGDVHGCFDEMQELLQALKYQAGNDRLIFVGDLINKGPDSLSVLKSVKEMGAEVILGNHELALLKQLDAGDEDSMPIIKKMGHEKEELLEWMRSWPLFIEEDDFIIVHGGLPPGMHPSEVEPRLLTTIRTWDGSGQEVKDEKNPAWYDLYDGKKLVVYGHWAKRGLVEKPLTIGLDSGCVYGNHLSGLILPERKIVQVAAKRCYQAIK